MASSRTTAGVLFMLTAQLLFVAVWSLVKHLGLRLPVLEIVFFRSLFSLAFLVPLVFRMVGSFRANDLGTVLLRSFLSFLSMVLSFWAMVHMAIGDAVTLVNTLPIFVALFAPSVIGERFDRRQFALVLVAFAGIALIAKPTSGLVTFVALAALGSGLLSSFSTLLIRKLADTDHALVITFYFTAFSVAASAPFAFSGFVMPARAEWLGLAAIGVAVSLGQVLLTTAYRYATASTIAPFGYFAVIGSYVSGLLFFGEVPDMGSGLGALTVVAAGVAILLTAPATREGVP